MGSYEIDTARITQVGVGYKNIRSNSISTGIAETEEIKTLREKYQDSLVKLHELFENWTDEDLLYALKDSDGDLELTASRITDGYANQWGEVKSRKHKKESNTKAKVSSGVSNQRGQSSRGGGGDRFNSERGRSRAEGGSYRGGKFSSSERERRQGSQRRENGTGHHNNRPPRQQNGPSHHHGYHNDDNGGSNKRNGGPMNNLSSGWNDATTGGSWDRASNFNTKGAWGNDKASSSFKSSLDTKESPTTGGGGGLNSPKPGLNNNANTTTTTTTTPRRTKIRRITTTTANAKNDISSSANTTENWNTDTKDAYAWSPTPAAKDSWNAEASKDIWTANSSWGESKLVDDITSHSPRPTNASKPSVNATKSPISPISRTIPAQSKTSWAQIVKPESKPEPRPEPVSSPPPKVSSEMPKSVSPRLPKSNAIPTTNITNTTTNNAASIQSSPTPKSFEPFNEATSIPSISSTEITTPSSVIDTSKTTEENLKEYGKETSLEHSTSSIASSPLVNASPRPKESLPPGLNNKSKRQTTTRQRKQDTPVVMPAGAGVERVGVQFGSLNLTSPTPEHAELESTSPVTTTQNIEEISSSVIATETQIQQKQASQNVTTSNINTFNNPTYFKQQEQTSASAAAYMGQQPHLGISEPYGSYLPTQPPSQISGFGIAPMQTLPEQYGTLYAHDAQRMMAYYTTDPAAYGQASPVTSNAYQNPYQQSGYGQPFVNKSIYPLYNTHHHHITKPGSASAASPYVYPTATPTTPNAPPHHYSHSSNSGYDDVTVAAAATNIHHLPGSGVPGVHDYQKYGAGASGGIPQLNFLNSGTNNNQSSSGVSAGSNSSSSGKNGNNGNELNPSNQYKGYDKSSSAGGIGGGQSASQHQ
ncbi:5807_t:CDS:10, partial [Ambispora leptoticha]